MNLWLDSNQNSAAVSSGQYKEVTKFGDLEPIFEVKSQLTQIDFIA